MKRRIVPIYELEVWFANDEADARAFLRKHGGDPEVMDDCLGICHQWTDKNGRGWRLMGAFDGKVGTVAHEAVHLGLDILDACGVREVQGGNQEALAFLVGWIVAEMLRIFPAK